MIAVRTFGDKGYIVTLMDESNKDRGSKVKTPDGKVFEATFRVAVAKFVYLLAAAINDKIWNRLAGDFAGDYQFCF